MALLRMLAKTIGGLVALVILALVIDIASFDRAAAQDDYERLKRGMAQHYANLDWMRDHRGLDVVALDRETSAALEGAWGRFGTWMAFRDFVAAFGDPHLHADWGEAPDWTHLVEVSQAGSVTSTDCDAEGYESEDREGELGLDGIAGWRDIGGDNFPAGIVHDTGVLRIAAFGEDMYRDACSQAQAEGQDQRALQLATRAILQADLRDTIGALREAGATRLLVDVTGNGGGSEWATEAAALFAQGTLRRAMPLMPEPACDRSGLWRGETVCPAFAADPQIEEMPGEGAWNGPLYILIDGNSASATEAFATWLAGSGKAKLVGTRTLGAGCGFIDGGNAVQLRSIPMHVMMPNCSRFTLDGVNEIEGLEPDIRLDWSRPDAVRGFMDEVGKAD